VVKYHPSWRIPYNGVVEIVSREVAPDVAYYLATSEQRNTAIGVGLVVDQGKGAWAVGLSDDEGGQPV
jgi:molecular chaperone Hsp33